QYGGSVGGPIRKDRAWLFGAYEATPNRSELTATSTVPTAAQRAGNFGSLAIYDPGTTRPNPNGAGYVRDQFPNNVIPASRFSALGASLLNSYPLANVPGNSTLFIANAPQRQDGKNGVVRGDVQVSGKDSMFGRYSISRGSLNASPGLPLPAETPVIRQTDSTSFGYGYTRTISPTFINELRFTWTTISLDQDATQALNPVIPGSLDPAVTSGTPTFNVSGYAGLGSQPSCCGNSPLRKSSGVWDWADNLSKSFGSHLLKFGGEFILIRPSTFAASNGRGSFGFTGVFSQNPQARSATGSSIADLLLGDANSLTAGTIANSVERSWFGAGYVQDQWTVNRQLTLNLGVRYEYAAPYIETKNRMANFILDPGDPLYGQLIQAGNSARPRSLIYGDTNNWAPRAGFAWRVPRTKDLVVRGAFGLFYGQDQGTGVTNRLTSNPPFFGYGAQVIASDQLFPASGFVLAPNASITRTPAIDPAKFALVPSATATLVSWPSHLKTPYVAQWSFSVEKSLPWNMTGEVNYVGNHGVQLLGVGEGNQPVVLAATTVISRRPLARSTVASVKSVRNWNASYYEGMSSKLEKRFQSGVSFLTTFTYGHALDLQNPALDLCDGCGSGDTIQNNYNLAANRASSDNDVRLRYVFGGSFDLPFGGGKLLGGWRATGIYQVQTGLPFTPSLSFDSANAGTVTRPNRVCDGNIDSRSLQHWFDTSCFMVPTTSLTFGNSGRNVLRAPGRNNLDFSVQRDFRLPIEHDAILQFRLEAFNALNHPQFAVPGATVGNAAYGMITGTSNENRQLQIGVRVAF
ncbi:MAG: TonB-dependent receptor, partial [Acidobacteriota bacterium]|nr:TonB-dependent receptor [Acidobacteriota bacterium]